MHHLSPPFSPLFRGCVFVLLVLVAPNELKHSKLPPPIKVKIQHFCALLGIILVPLQRKVLCILHFVVWNLMQSNFKCYSIMRKFIWSFLLLMLGVVTVGAQGTVVTSVANPIKYKELIGGRQVLLKNNSTSRYLCIDASVNDIVRAETLSAPTAATAAYIFTMVPSGDGYNLKCTIDGVGYYVTHVAGGWAGWSNDATSAAV